jgi:putative membrane protein
MSSLRLAWLDLKRLSRSRFVRVALIAVCLMPLLYSFLYLYASWDPYGRMNNLPVALVNEDQGGTLNGQAKNIGRDLTGKLVKGQDVKWQVVSREAADEGLKTGQFYLALYVPSDFTAKVLTASGDQPQKAQLTYVANSGANYLASTIGKRVMDQVQAQLSDEIAGQSFVSMLVGLKDGSDGLKSAADGARQLADGQAAALAGARSLRSGAGQLQQGAAQLTAGASQATAGATRLAAGIDQASTKLAAAGQGAAQIQAGAAQLAGGLTQLQAGLDGGLAQVSGGVNNSAAGLAAAQGLLQRYAAANPAAAADPSFQQALAAMGKVQAGLSQQVAPGLTQLQSTSDGALTQLGAGAAQIQSGAQQLGAGLNDPSGMNQLKVGAAQLATALTQVQDGSAKLDRGLADLHTGAGSLAGGLADLTDGSRTLAGKLADAAGSMAAEAQGDPAQRGEVLGAPVSLVEQPMNEVREYGTGLAPYFIPLSLWVGAMVLFFVVRTRENRIKTAPVPGAVAALAKFWTVAVLGALQAAVSTWVLVTFLHLHTAAPLWQLYSFDLLLSLTFVAMMQLLVSVAGMVGRFAAMVLMMLQITSCAGTFPLEMLPPFFRAISPYLPMTYATAGLRQIIAGGSTVPIGTSLAVLAGFLAAALLLTMAAETRSLSVKDLHPAAELAG